MADLITEDECPTKHEFQPKTLTVASSPFRSPNHLCLLQTESHKFVTQTEPEDSPPDRFYDPFSPDKALSPQPDAIPALEMSYVLTSKLSCQKQEDARTGATVTSPHEIDERHFSAHFHPDEPGAMISEKQLSSAVKHDLVQTGCVFETDQEQNEQSDVTCDVKVGSLSTSVCHDSDKERNTLEAPFSTDGARKEPQIMPEPDADSLVKSQFNSAIKTDCTTTRASPTNFATVTDAKPEVVSPSICCVIPVSSSPDKNALSRRRTNKESRRPCRTGHVFERNQKVKVQTSSDPGSSVVSRRANNTKTWNALKTFDLVGRLAETSDLDRMARGDVDVLYSVLSLTADAGINVAEKILGTKRVDRIDEVMANSTRTFHTAYFCLAQTSVCATVRDKITSFWSRTSVGRLFTFISGWQAEKAQSLYHKVSCIHQDGGFKESFSSSSGRAELWRVPTFISFPILIAAYCVAHLLLLCHVICLFLSGRACVKGGNKASVYTLNSSPSKTKFTSKARPPQTQRLNGNKDGKVPLRRSKTRAKERETRMKMFPSEKGYTVKENEDQSDDLVKLTKALTKSPTRVMPVNKINKHNVRTEEGPRNERACADSSERLSDSSKQQSRDTSLQDSTTASGTSAFFESEDLDSSGSSDVTESRRKRIKLTPVRRMTAFLRKHGYQFKTRLVTPSSTPNIILYENLTLGQRLICLLRKIPVLAELLRDPRDPAPVVFLFGACSCVDNEKTRRILQMAPPRAPSQYLKRKLDNVYPPETDTGDEVWNSSDEECDDGPNDDVPLTRETSSQPLAGESDGGKGRDLRLCFTKPVESVSGKIPHLPTSKSAEKTTRSKASGQVFGSLRSNYAQESGDERSESILSKTH